MRASEGPVAAAERRSPAGRRLGAVALARRGPLASALATVGLWLLEPAEPAREPALAAAAPPRPVVAVFGLGRGCGATVVARALAAELARRDVHGVAAVHCEARASGIPLATPAASRLARHLADVPGADTRAVGRLCLVGGPDCTAIADTARHVAPLVLDAGSTALGGVAAALADQVLVVSGPSTEPALAAVAAECLARVGHEPILVRNRARGLPAGPRFHAIPDSRMGAQLALGGREPHGELGRAIADLADRCEWR